MKKATKIAVLSGVMFVGAVASCKDDFLNSQPYGAVNESILANAKGADALLISAYSLADGFGGWGNGQPWGGAVTNWTFGSIAGGDSYKGSEANDQPTITPIERHETDGNNDYIGGKWGNLYDGVARANKAISVLKVIKDMPAALQAQRIGEAKFLRAYYHFEAKKVFGNIPYIDETIEDSRIPNDKDVWPNIIADFEAAAAALPADQAQVGRATKGAAQAMLGKAYLYTKNWAKAKENFDKVITSGKYKLNASFHDNFRALGRNASESVFQVQQAINEGTEGDNGNIGEVLNHPNGGGPGGCCGFHQPSQWLVNSYKVDAKGLPLVDTFNAVDLKNDQGVRGDAPFTPSTETVDPRLDFTVGRRGIPYLDWGPHPGVNWIRDQAYAGPYSPKKSIYYKADENIYTTATGWTKGYTAINYNIIRYADVLLMAAEAEVELGNLEKAREYVNIVRTRAAASVVGPNGTPVVNIPANKPAASYACSNYTAAWTDANAARKAVRFERKLELAMEGHRFFDLVRWGTAADELNTYLTAESKKRTYLAGASFKAGKSEFRPIPIQQITLSAKGGTAQLKQNPGY